MRPVDECEACTVGLFATCGDFGVCMHQHPQTLVNYPLEYDLATSRDSYLDTPTAPEGMIGVDRGVVPLLQSLWDFEVRTWVSCQGDEGETGYVAYHHDDHYWALTVATNIWPSASLDVTPLTSARHSHWRIGFPSVQATAPHA